MTILEVQKRLEELYEENGNIEVLVLTDNEEIEYNPYRNIYAINVEGEIPNESVVIQI